MWQQLWLASNKQRRLGGEERRANRAGRRVGYRLHEPYPRVDRPSDLAVHLDGAHAQRGRPTVAGGRSGHRAGAEAWMSDAGSGDKGGGSSAGSGTQLVGRVQRSAADFMIELSYCSEQWKNK